MFKYFQKLFTKEKGWVLIDKTVLASPSEIKDKSYNRWSDIKLSGDDVLKFYEQCIVLVFKNVDTGEIKIEKQSALKKDQ